VRCLRVCERRANGDVAALLMLALVGLAAFNLLVLLAPPGALLDVLELMQLPASARTVLAVAVGANVGLSLAFERWGTQAVALALGWARVQWRHGRRRVRDGKAYKAIEP
jgi:cation-transporting ATPase 13A2